MGTMKHHAILIISWKEEHIKEAFEMALTLFPGQTVSPITTPLNAYYFFSVSPDGSKEYWPESDLMDDKRRLFTEWLESQNFYLDWAEVAFGGNDKSAVVERFGHYVEKGE